MNEPSDKEAYRQYVKKRLEGLLQVFAKASLADFSDNIDVHEEEDEFKLLYAGIQVMLEVIRRQIGDVNKSNQSLTKVVEEKTVELNRQLNLFKALLNAQ